MINTNKKLLKQEFKKRIYQYIIKLIKFLQKLPQSLVIREIISQLMRSGTSIGANYFEAEGASSKKDYQNYFNHSLKSANETRFWLYVLRDTMTIGPELISELDWLIKETSELSSIFASSILTMKGKR